MTEIDLITPEQLIEIAEDQTWYDGGSAIHDIRGVLRSAAETIRQLQAQPRPLANFSYPKPEPKRRT